LAKMEKRMQKSVTLLEKYMSQRYNLENTQPLSEDVPEPS
jgi:hypothetical protein